MNPIEVLAKHIANRNSSGVLETMFQRNPLCLRDGFFKEDELWDYKEDVPPIGRGNEIQWANIAADVLAFHNNKGGVLAFGIRNSDRHALGDCYVKSGIVQRAVEVLEPLLDHQAAKTKEKTYPLLLECYENLGEILKAAEIRNRMVHAS